MRVNLLQDKDLRQCVRERRAERGLGGAELAKRAGISPSYVSLIESGSRIPNEETAARIAKALGDDPQLYRVLAARSRLGAAIRDPIILRSLAEEMEAGATESSPDEAIQELAVVAPGPSRPDRTGVVRVPLLAEGTDPTPGRDFGRIARGSLQIERRLLPALAGPRLFAYRIGSRLAQRVRGILSEGDEVVLTAEATKELRGDRLYAIRVDGRVILSRALWKKPLLLLLPPEGETDFEILPAPRATDLPRLVAGRVLLSIHSWN